MIMEKFSMWSVLKSPVITEKSVILREQSGDGNGIQVLTFRVDRKASKNYIRRAVEEIFGVKVVGIRTMRYTGKIKRKGRYKGRRPSWKKAYVTLKKGEPLVDYAEAI